MRRRQGSAPEEDPELRHISRAALFLVAVFLLREVVWHGYYRTLNTERDPSVGDVAARRKLDGQLESLREKLIENSGAPLLRTMELSYAKYPVGGYYRRHIDVPRSVYYMLGRNGATDYSLQERRECPRLTPSTRRCPQNCICTMAWRFTKV